VKLATKPRDRITFRYSDSVPVKHCHYMREYDFEKNLPSIKENVSK